MTKKALLFISLILFIGFQSEAQNWTTHCGNNERNGRSELPGPHDIDNALWTVTDAAPTGLGMNIYSFGDLFVTSRVIFSPYQAIIECRSLITGELMWTSPDLGAESILFAMGFNEDAIYAHDYNSNLFYALNVSDGSVKWVSPELSYTFGPMDGVIYTCDRNIVINGDIGSVDESTICLDKETGEKIWANSNWFAVAPNESKAAHGNRLYLITGAINQPKKLTAVDLRDGSTLYNSDPLAGDGDQEGPICISPDGTIYFRRDGGDFFAMRDNGSGFDLLWTYSPINMGLLLMNFGIDNEGNILIMDNLKMYRLDKTSGHPLDSSIVNSLGDGRITISSDSVIYINNTNGGFYALSYDLQTTLWSIPNLNGSYYAGPSLSKEGIMVISGSGSNIKAYKFNGQHAPVADFAVSDYHINQGENIDFTDQSSFGAISWQWEFPGGEPSSSTDQYPQHIGYQQPDTYSIKLIATNEYGSDTITKLCYIQVDLVEGIESPVSAGSISIYPNPVKGSGQFSTEQSASIFIYSSSGQMVYADDSYKTERRIDFSRFTPGMYIARFKGNDFSKSEKFIINR
jgi:outer membrane protein assembly factor BamB